MKAFKTLALAATLMTGVASTALAGGGPHEPQPTVINCGAQKQIKYFGWGPLALGPVTDYTLEEGNFEIQFKNGDVYRSKEQGTGAAGVLTDRSGKVFRCIQLDDLDI